MIDRRRFVCALGALGLTRAPFALGAGVPRFAGSAFGLGVASGYPSASGATLWTRLFDAQQPDGLPQGALPVRWEVAADERFRRIVARGTAAAEPRWAHSVHVDVRGLAPRRCYSYRFFCGAEQSPSGRFCTAPAAAQSVGELRFAVASCQQYEQGYYDAYRHLRLDEPELILFLGDYIYESSWGRNLVRTHGAPEAYSLEEYRRRHALYKSDPDLQAAHAACAWLLTWDDHEVDNDYANDRPEDGMPAELFLARRAAAYQAYYEHMPLPASMKPRGPALPLYTDVPWGSLARFYLLDDRQYRSHQVCPRPGRGGANVVGSGQCGELDDPARTLLGVEQEHWLGAALSESRAGWNLIGQQTLVAPFAGRREGQSEVWTDGWDGYPAARRRLVQQLRAAPNPVTFGGDMHAFYVADLKSDPSEDGAPVIASEFVTSSITSQPRSQAHLDLLARANPHIKVADGRHRGYLRATLRRDRLEVDLRAMRSVARRGAECFTLASFIVENGTPGAQRR